MGLHIGWGWEGALNLITPSFFSVQIWCLHCGRDMQEAGTGTCFAFRQITSCK